jgi:hypothetical protein
MASRIARESSTTRTVVSLARWLTIAGIDGGDERSRIQDELHFARRADGATGVESHPGQDGRELFDDDLARTDDLVAGQCDALAKVVQAEDGKSLAGFVHRKAQDLVQ